MWGNSIIQISRLRIHHKRVHSTSVKSVMGKQLLIHSKADELEMVDESENDQNGLESENVEQDNEMSQDGVDEVNVDLDELTDEYIIPIGVIDHFTKKFPAYLIENNLKKSTATRNARI